jgi:hypothetical protein
MMARNPDSFDFWDEAEADAALERLSREGGERLAEVRAILHEGMRERADEHEGAEGLKRQIRLWRLRQSRLIDAVLMEPGGDQERAYLAVLRKARRAIKAGRPLPLTDTQAELTTILDLPNNPRFHHLQALIEEGVNSGPGKPLDIEDIKARGRERRAARRDIVTVFDEEDAEEEE